MCNCGKKRNEFTRQQTYTRPVNVAQQQSFTQNKQTISFQYTGNTALTVTGGFTRKNYRFNFPGDVQQIELSDASAMASVPVLKKV